MLYNLCEDDECLTDSPIDKVSTGRSFSPSNDRRAEFTRIDVAVVRVQPISVSAFLR